MEQSLINYIFAALGAAASFILKVIWDGLRELQKSDIAINAEVARVKLLMADSYIKKIDFDRLAQAIFTKLDRIEDKVDNKADKP